MNIMLNLDKRCQEILKRLMYAGGYLKIQDLADEMQISRRSVYYDITKINEWLEDQRPGWTECPGWPETPPVQ